MCLFLEWQTTHKPWVFLKIVDKHLLQRKHFQKVAELNVEPDIFASDLEQEE